MISDVQIANMALSHLGERPVITALFPPDPSKFAADASTMYPIARDVVLVAHDWDFARRRVALAAVTNDVDSWEFAYELPNDCLKPRAVLDTGSADDYPNTGKGYNFVVDGSTVRTNVDDAVLVYTARVESTGTYTVEMAVALSYYLAHLLAGPVVKSAKVAAAMLTLYNSALGKATETESNGHRSKVPHVPPWIKARGGNPDPFPYIPPVRS